MNPANAITELQSLANSISLQDIQMMQSHGGTNSIYEFVQLMIDTRIQRLQQQEPQQ